MKTPLKYQITEYDCGAISLLNAFSYLYDREDIPALLVKQIFKYTLDKYDKEGNLGNGGTSEEAVSKFAKWLAHYANSNDFGVECKVLEGKDVTLESISNCLQEGGVVFAKCWQDTEHYVIFTKIKNKRVYIFDPYYLEKSYYNRDRQVRIVTNKPFTHNRVATLKRVFSNSTKDFSLGPIEQRECILINKI